MLAEMKKNNQNVARKLSSTNCVYITGDSIVKHANTANRYDISRKTENSKVFVLPSMVQQCDV